jgi:hypothetical protein
MDIITAASVIYSIYDKAAGYWSGVFSISVKVGVGVGVFLDRISRQTKDDFYFDTSKRDLTNG